MERLCRLCWKVIDGDNFEIIGEVRKEMLEVLLLKLDLPHSKETIMCSHCIEQLEKSFEFKATCLYTEDYIFPLIKQNDKIDMRQVYSGNEWKIVISIAVDEDVCRLCMGVFENRFFNTLEEVDRNMLQKCIPEVNLTFSQKTLFCKTCLTSLTCYFNFASICMETNKKMKTFLKSGSILNTPQLSVQLSRINLFTSSKTSPVVRERDLKNMEEDNQTENGSKLRDASSATKDNKFEDNKSLPIKQRNKININKCAKDKQTLTCGICSRSYSSKMALANHKLLLHGEGQSVKLYECDKCFHKSKYKYNFLKHALVHKSSLETKAYKCDKCPFKTKHKKNLKVHSLVHRDSKDVVLYGCKYCLFQSNRRDSLRKHIWTHKRDSEEVELYECKYCPYKSNRRDTLNKHILTHKTNSEVEIFSCNLCTFESKYKSNLRKHQIRHKGKSELLSKATYECYHCQYKSNQKTNLIRHLKIHEKLMDMNQSEVQLYCCEKCTFATRHRGNLIRHIMTHMDSSHLNMFKCEICSYQSREKCNLKRHTLIHKKTEESSNNV